MIRPLRDRLVLLGLALVSACATTSSFDRAFEARRFDEAAAAFRSDSTLHTQARALYRAALLHGTPGLETYDPALARELLERMLALDPGAATWESTSLLSLLREQQRAEEVASHREGELEARTGRLAAEADGLRQRIAWLEARLHAQDDQNEVLRRVITRLEADLRDRETRLDALQDELDRLKAIDLRAPPRPPPRENDSSAHYQG